jgi:signal transduction histidine kinase
VRQIAETAQKPETNGAGPRCVEAVVGKSAPLSNHGESMAGVAHDARNMVAALGLYCDLLEEPGVLAAPFAHLSSELRLVTAASRGLLERLVLLDAHNGTERMEGSGLGGTNCSDLSLRRSAGEGPGRRNLLRDVNLPEPVGNLTQELVASCNLLSALAGPAIALTMDVEGGLLPVRLTATDLTRVLVNLVKNAAEALPSGGRIEIGLSERKTAAGANYLVLAIDDNGPGIPEGSLERIFEPGFTTCGRQIRAAEGWPVSHRGLGLAICRSIVETAGGSIRASNCAEGGARFEIELPVTAD